MRRLMARVRWLNVGKMGYQIYDLLTKYERVKVMPLPAGCSRPRANSGFLWTQIIQQLLTILNAQAVKDIFPRLTIFGWGFDVEVLAIARLEGYKIKESPVTWNNGPDSKVTLWAYIQCLLETLQVSRNRLLGVYKKTLD